MAAMIHFAALTGVRPGELWALKPEDVVGDTLVVRRACDSHTRTVGLPKNGRARTIALPLAAREAAERAPRLEGQEWLFVGPRGQQIYASAFSWLWQGVRAGAGRPRMTFYELRHFAATRLLELGLSPADVAVQLGHTDGGALVHEHVRPPVRASRPRTGFSPCTTGTTRATSRPFERDGGQDDHSPSTAGLPGVPAATGRFGSVGPVSPTRRRGANELARVRTGASLFHVAPARTGEEERTVPNADFGLRVSVSYRSRRSRRRKARSAVQEQVDGREWGLRCFGRPAARRSATIAGRPKRE
jgi:hypothetical protein